MASALTQADLLLTQSLLSDTDISFLKEVAVPEDPQVEWVLFILPHHSLLIDVCA